MLEVKTLQGKEAHDLVLNTLEKLHDLVTPTMGAKGLMALIDDPMNQPMLTDDGVTVIKNLRNLSNGFERMVALSAIEGCHNTERQAKDGTTLTIQLMTHIFKHGYEMIYTGKMHPQTVAQIIDKQMQEVVGKIEKQPMTKKMVKDVATISSKLPLLGDRIAEAHGYAGNDMNIIIKHDQTGHGVKIEHVEGMTIDDGFLSEAMRVNGEEFKNAKAVLLKSPNMTQMMVSKFIKSIPQEDVVNRTPFIFFITPNFNPEAMRQLINSFIEADGNFQFVFLNGTGTDDIYMDLAAITGGTVQDVSAGVKDYTFKMCGDIKNIKIDVNKTTLVGISGAENRIKYYEKKMKDKQFKITEGESVHIIKRLGSLKQGITTLKIGVPTIMEFTSWKTKFDDAIGAVKKAFEHGVTIGGGKALYNLRNEFKDIAHILEEPHRRILANAGIEVKPYRVHRNGIDVVSGKKVELIEHGIIDGYASVKFALINATSIAVGFLKTYTLIKEESTKK